MIIFNSREQGKGKAASPRQGQLSAGRLAQAAAGCPAPHGGTPAVLPGGPGLAGLSF